MYPELPAHKTDTSPLVLGEKSEQDQVVLTDTHLFLQTLCVHIVSSLVSKSVKALIDRGTRESFIL